MTITALPTPPSRADSATFSTRADAFMSALPTFATEANALASAVSSSASDASGYASAASGSASAASGSSSSASGSASAAAISALAASGSASTAYAAFDSFDLRYLGSKSANPTTDNKGGALVAGMIYYNSTVPELRLYSSGAWGAAYVSGGSVETLATPRAIYGNNFNGSAALTQVIASTYGGTGNGFTKFSGPTTSEKTFTLPDASASLGYLGIPQNSNSANYTTVLADAGKHLLHPSADTSARTFTIDSNANVAYPVGTALSFINQASGGVITIAITSDTMRLAGAGTTGSRTLAANGIATAIKVTSTEWIIGGTGLT